MDPKLFLAVFGTVFVAELGDKTQLATLLYAADAKDARLTVFVAAASALAHLGPRRARGRLHRGVGEPARPALDCGRGLRRDRALDPAARRRRRLKSGETPKAESGILPRREGTAQLSPQSPLKPVPRCHERV